MAKDSPDNPTQLSGKFILRIPPTLHQKLLRASHRSHASLNLECRRRLEDSFKPNQDEQFSQSFFKECDRLWGPDLKAILLTQNQKEILFVLRREAELLRKYYSEWETRLASLAEPGLRPSFIRMPAPMQPADPAWFEIATDSLVLWEKDRQISRLLISFRQAIANQEHVRSPQADGRILWLRKSGERSTGPSLHDGAQDRLRLQARLKAVALLYKEESWADVVHQSQQLIELTLRTLLTKAQVDPPRGGDLSELLLQHYPELTQLAADSRELRRDRELAFYGSLELYKKSDARKAKAQAEEAIAVLLKI